MPNAWISAWRRAVCIVGVIGAAAACAGSTSVHPFGGSYTLTSVNGRHLPQPEYSNTNNPQIAGGTLTVDPDTMYMFLTLQPVNGSGDPVGDPVLTEEKLPYIREADSLVLEDAGPAGGTIVGSNVRLVVLPPPSSTGFTAGENRYLFVPQ